MKRVTVLYGILIFNTTIAQNDWATWDFLLNELEIIPANPLPGQEVKLAYDIHTFMDVDYYGDNLNIIGTEITIKSCMSVSLVPTNETIKDTLSLGVLGAETYSISFKLYGDYAPPYCDDYNTANDSVWRDTTFLVSISNDIVKEETNSVTVYPNPTSDFIHLTHNGNVEFQITIMDKLGRSVFILEKSEVLVSPITIDLSPLESGVYFLFYDSSDRRYVIKILKE